MKITEVTKKVLQYERESRKDIHYKYRNKYNYKKKDIKDKKFMELLLEVLTGGKQI